MSKKSLGYRFASWLVDRPYQALAVLAVLLLISVPFLKHVKQDFSYRIWFREGDPLLKEFDAFERRFGNDESLVVVVHSPSGIFDEDSAELLRDLTREMWKVPEIIRVDSLSNYSWVHAVGDEIRVEPLIPDDEKLTPKFLAQRKEVALKHEVLPEYLVSRDAQSALIFAQLKPALNSSPDYDRIVKSTYQTLEPFRRGDHQFFLSGGVEISNSFKVATWGDLQRIIPVVLGLAVVFLAFFFRRPSGVILPFLIIFFSVIMTLATTVLFGFKINNLTSIIPQILVAVGMAECVHIMATYFQIRKTGVDRKEATRLSVTKNFLPTILTSVTTSIGFFSFVNAPLKPISELGMLAGLGTAYAWILTHLLVPPLLSLVPLKVKKDPKQEEFDEPAAWSLRVSEWLNSAKYYVIAAFAIISCIAFYLTSKNVVNSDPLEYFTDEVPLRIATKFLEERVGSAMGAEFVINSGKPEGVKEPEFLKRVEAFESWLSAKPYVTKTVSIIDILKSMNRSLHGENQAYYRVPEKKDAIAQQLFLYTMNLPQGMDINNRITLANDALRLSIMWKIHDSKTAIEYYKEFIAKGKELGLDVHITGKPPLYQQMNDYVVDSFVGSILSSTILICGLLAVALRSFRLGLLAMIPNIIPLSFGGLFIYLTHQYVDIGTVLVASITLGISVDDTIHFLANYRRLRQEGVERKRTIAVILTHTGPALLITTLVLVFSFGCFVLATFKPNQNFGILCALILTLALVSEFLLTPAILLLVDPRKKPKSDMTL